MIQLSYHPAFDAGHAMFRVLRLRAGLKLSAIELDKFRILDFYLLFPHRVSAVRLKQSDLQLRALARKAEVFAGYAALPNDKALFARMEPAQIAAIQTLANKGALDGGDLRIGILRFEDYPLPQDINNRVAEANSEHEGLALKIVERLSGYPLLGSDGLKSRTDLLEHRYDKV